MTTVIERLLFRDTKTLKTGDLEASPESEQASDDEFSSYSILGLPFKRRPSSSGQFGWFDCYKSRWMHVGERVLIVRSLVMSIES